MSRKRAKREIRNFGEFIGNQSPHVYKGEKNKTVFPEFVDLCKQTQEKLKQLLPLKLVEAGYKEVVAGDGYIYAKGNIPILLTAHMDTVHKETIKDFYEYIDEKGNHIISSPQGIGGDDRCGIYMILEIIKDLKPSILFCEDEEIGGIGSNKFSKTSFIKELEQLNYLIELDRMNGKDAVFYSCDNPEFTKFITDTTGYKEAWGSFSDISILAPACGVAAVNLSCGYYHAHNLREEVNIEEMLHTIEIVKKLLETDSAQYEYIERYEEYGYNFYSDCYGFNRYPGNYIGYETTQKKPKGLIDEDSSIILMVDYINSYTSEEEIEYEAGKTKEECWGRFFMNNPHVCFNDVLDYDWDVEV